jgi:hypothetical protein
MQARVPFADDAEAWDLGAQRHDERLVAIHVRRVASAVDGARADP